MLIVGVVRGSYVLITSFIARQHRRWNEILILLLAFFSIATRACFLLFLKKTLLLTNSANNDELELNFLDIETAIFFHSCLLSYSTQILCLRLSIAQRDFHRNFTASFLYIYLNRKAFCLVSLNVLFLLSTF